MAIQEKSRRRLNCIKYVSRADDAIDLKASDLEAYQKDPLKNADKLVLKEGCEPTYFLLNFELSAKDALKIKDARTKNDEDSKVQITMGNWALHTVRYVLKDILNPPGVKDVEFKKDGRGYVADSTLDKLERFGIIDEIWSVYLAMTNEKQEEEEAAPN
jgi:hypothetical protein